MEVLLELWSISYFYTKLKAIAFMLLVGKPQNRVILVARIILIIIKSKHIKTYQFFATTTILLYYKIATQYLQCNSELLGQKYKLYIMNFYVPSKWLEIVDLLQATSAAPFGLSRRCNMCGAARKF